MKCLILSTPPWIWVYPEVDVSFWVINSYQDCYWLPVNLIYMFYIIIELRPKVHYNKNKILESSFQDEKLCFSDSILSLIYGMWIASPNYYYLTVNISITTQRK